MCVCAIVVESFHQIPIGRPELYSSIDINMVGLMPRLSRCIWNTGKLVIMGRIFCVFKGPLEMSNRGSYGSALIKRYDNGLGGFVEM